MYVDIYIYIDLGTGQKRKKNERARLGELWSVVKAGGYFHKGLCPTIIIKLSIK